MHRLVRYFAHLLSEWTLGPWRLEPWGVPVFFSLRPARRSPSA